MIQERKIKSFISITSETLDNKLVYLSASSGESLTNEQGIDYKQAVDFLFKLRHKRKRIGGIVFVCYNFQRDNEFIFSTMPREMKDKLFQSYRIKKEIDELNYDLERITDDYYTNLPGTQEFELADFERYTTQLALDELTEVEFDGYKLELVNGKFLTIHKSKKSITIYDLAGFFKPFDLRRSVFQFTGEQQPLLDSIAFSAHDFFDGESEMDRLKNHAAFVQGYVQRLVTKLNESLILNGIKLSKFHGASAVSSHILSRSKAKSQYHSYRHKRQLPPQMFKALRQSVFGGRAEQLKIGTLENVNVYDINSAYAYAATMLPMMLQKPAIKKDYDPSLPFSFWHCDYDFTKAGLYFGLLPNREMTTFTKYKLKGSGYFWQPELKYVNDNFPECVVIGQGYAVETETAPFCKEIEELFNLRLRLQAGLDPLERVLKLALSSIYGKFCQHNGTSYYYNLFYAGFITSVTRAMLLEATKDYEQDTVCFQTDAIHTTADLPITIAPGLGAYKKTRFEKTTYLDNGVYQCYNENTVCKTKTRGFRRFHFQECLDELKLKRTYTALAEFFVGHNLFSRNMFTGAGYLSDFGASKTMNPTEKNMTAMRNFISSDCLDLTTDFLDSVPIESYNGIESIPYNVGSGHFLEKVLAMEAARV